MARRSRSRVRPTKRAAPPEVLLRGLSVLEALNQRPVCSVDQIARATALPKPTVVRVLKILSSRDYAEQLPRRRGYCLGKRVQSLSSGYRSRDAVVEIARPILSRFTQEHRWPLSLATLDLDAMRIRAGTLQESPFSTSIDQNRMARRVPMLTSAVGLAYLAFCPADERETILTLLRGSKRVHDLSARDRETLKDLLAGIVAQGYAPSPKFKGEAAVGFAIPVQVGARVIASVTMRYFGKAMSERQVARRFLAPMREVAEAIAAGYLTHAGAGQFVRRGLVPAD